MATATQEVLLKFSHQTLMVNFCGCLQYLILLSFIRKKEFVNSCKIKLIYKQEGRECARKFSKVLAKEIKNKINKNELVNKVGFIVYQGLLLWQHSYVV
jgi:hypothetical protein